MLLSRPNDEPDDTDIQADDPDDVLPPDGPGDAVEPPVDVPAGLSKPAVYTRQSRNVTKYFYFVTLLK